MLTRKLKFLSFIVLLFTLTSVVSCTSSDDDTSEIEEEIEGSADEGNSETMTDDIEDLSEVAEEDLKDEVEDEDKFEESTDEEVAEGEELEDEGEVADDDADMKEFDELDKDDKNFAQNEKALEAELAKKPGGAEYPVAENAQPAFPEEVIGQNGQGMPPGGLPPGVAPGMPPGAVPPPGMPGDSTQGITSETQDIASIDNSEPPLPQEDLGKADPLVPVDDDEASTTNWIPVVKVKTDPFFRNERVMNAVYIARPKDDIQNISEKLFQADRSEELKSDNPHLAKGVDPGDKVYYNSPNRPDDKTNLKNYYEDMGLKPQFYTTKNDDNIRRLGSKLLGFPDGWKELWAINPNIDSKTILPNGMEVKYWTGEESATNMQASTGGGKSDGTAAPSAPIAAEEMGEAQEIAGVGSVGAESFGNEPELPPEPPLPEAQLAMPENNIEPEMVPDIEPFPEAGVESTPNASAVTAVDQNQSLLSVGAVALLLMAGVGLLAIQIKKRKDNTGMRPQSLEYTQV